MSYIANISTLSPKKLNWLSRSIINRMGINTNDDMVQSSVIREKTLASLDMSLNTMLTKGTKHKFVPYGKRTYSNFLCNIQQIKDKFSGVYFVMYYRNCASVYYIPKNKYSTFSRYVKCQHSGNTNEKQIFINSCNVCQLEPYFIKNVKYSSLI